MTAIHGEVFQAAEFNVHVRDNLTFLKGETETLDTRASALESGVFAKGSSFVSAYESTSSTSFTDLSTAGPAVTLTTGTLALVLIQSYLEGVGTGKMAQASFAVSGATTLAASSERAVHCFNNVLQAGTHHWAALNAGSNTFTMKYRREGGSGDVFFQRRRITVIPF
jgi:hypothetical protein